MLHNQIMALVLDKKVKITDLPTSTAKVARRMLDGEKVSPSDVPENKGSVGQARTMLERYGYVMQSEKGQWQGIGKGRPPVYWFVKNPDHRPDLTAQSSNGSASNGDGKTKRPYKTRKVYIPAPLMRSTLTVAGVIEQDDDTIQLMLKNEEGRWWVLVQGFSAAERENVT